MLRLILLCGFTLTVWTASVSLADDAPISDSVVRVYPVGDLVSIAATSGGTASGDWDAVAPETLKALDQLGSIVESMALQKPVTVRTYAPTLSLVVRHTPEGHKEIAHLLHSLGETDRCSIQVEFRPVDFEKLDALAEADESNSLSLLMKRQLTAEQTTELLELLGPNEAHVESVTLKSGRRTSWGHAYLPRTVTGRVDHSTRRVALRIDFVTGDGEAVPPVYGTESLALAAGESALFTHFYDGARMGWLVSARTLSIENQPLAQPGAGVRQ